MTTSAARPSFIDDLGLELDDDDAAFSSSSSSSRALRGAASAAASAAAAAAAAAAQRAVLSGLADGSLGGGLGGGLGGLGGVGGRLGGVNLRETDGYYLNRYGLDGRRGTADANAALYGGSGGDELLDSYYGEGAERDADWPL